MPRIEPISRAQAEALTRAAVLQLLRDLARQLADTPYDPAWAVQRVLRQLEESPVSRPRG